MYTSSGATGIDLGQVFLATESTEQVFSRRHWFWVYFGDLVQLPKSTHTLLEPSFVLTMTMGDA